MEKAIIVNDVTKKYKLYNGTKERILDLITPKSYGEDFFALRNINFKAEKGDAIGFIGINGSGKSTLSNIIAGIVPQTSGSVEVNGETSLIAVAAGLKGDLTGRDNIELKCLMLGFNKEEIKELEPAIIEFSELGKFIDQPVKSYSSGMKSRLGFAISVSVDPDVLIIDEALSVGDRAFAEKSLAKMKEFKEQEKTMIFVSHSIGQMKEFCEKILWLEYGVVKDYGPVEEVIPKYEAFLNAWKNMSREAREDYRQESLESQQNRLLFDYREEATSRLGHIELGTSYIYPAPFIEIGKESSEKYKHSVYYIKKQAIYDGELYYLLSNEPSATRGIVGWMKASDIKSYRHEGVDRKLKTFHIKGTGGAGYNRAWGGKENQVYPDLKLLKEMEFNVSLTEKVGSNLWYRGDLDGERTWIHSSYVESK